jgi:hypothetical protein
LLGALDRRSAFAIVLPFIQHLPVINQLLPDPDSTLKYHEFTYEPGVYPVHIRIRSIQLLGQFGDRKAIQPLLLLIKNPSEAMDLREEAIKAVIAIAQTNRTRYPNDIVEVKSNFWRLIRMETPLKLDILLLGGLCQLHDIDAIDRLIVILQEMALTREMLVVIAQQLGAIDPVETAKLFVEQILDIRTPVFQKPVMVHCILEILPTQCNKFLVPLIYSPHISIEIRRIIIQILILNKHPVLKDLIEFFLNGPEPEFRKYAIDIALIFPSETVLKAILDYAISLPEEDLFRTKLRSVFINFDFLPFVTRFSEAELDVIIPVLLENIPRYYAALSILMESSTPNLRPMLRRIANLLQPICRTSTPYQLLL